MHEVIPNTDDYVSDCTPLYADPYNHKGRYVAPRNCKKDLLRAPTDWTAGYAVTMNKIATGVLRADRVRRWREYWEGAARLTATTHSNVLPIRMRDELPKDARIVIAQEIETLVGWEMWEDNATGPSDEGEYSLKTVEMRELTPKDHDDPTRPKLLDRHQSPQHCRQACALWVLRRGVTWVGTIEPTHRTAILPPTSLGVQEISRLASGEDPTKANGDYFGDSYSDEVQQLVGVEKLEWKLKPGPTLAKIRVWKPTSDPAEAPTEHTIQYSVKHCPCDRYTEIQVPVGGGGKRK